MTKRLTKTLGLILALVLVTACDSPTEPIPSVAGAWAGEAENIRLEVDLTETDGTIGGTGRIFLDGGTPIGLLVSQGSFNGEHLYVTLGSNAFPYFIVRGNVTIRNGKASEWNATLEDFAPYAGTIRLIKP